MLKHFSVISVAKGVSIALILAGCTLETPTGPSGTPVSVPDQIAAAAAPNQDLSSVQLNAEDNCYWYRHVGPVETTMLPLRNTRGRPICAAPVEPTPAA